MDGRDAKTALTPPRPAPPRTLDSPCRGARAEPRTCFAFAAASQFIASEALAQEAADETLPAPPHPAPGLPDEKQRVIAVQGAG